MNYKHALLFMLSVAVMSSVSFGGDRGSPGSSEPTIKVYDFTSPQTAAVAANIVALVPVNPPELTPVAENIATFDADAAEALKDRSEAVATVLITQLSKNIFYNKNTYQIRAVEKSGIPNRYPGMGLQAYMHKDAFYIHRYRAGTPKDAPERSFA